MRFIRNIWEDIRKGENLDLYLTLLAASVLSILTILSITPTQWIAPITLAILTLLTISQIGNRYRIDSIISKLEKAPGDVLLEEFPAIINQTLLESESVILIGYTLRHTITNTDNYDVLERKVKKGHKLQVLVLDPDGISISLAHKRVYREQTKDQFREAILETLHNLRNLKKLSPNSVIIKIIDQPFSFGFQAFNLNTKENGVIYAEHYPIKMPKDAPKLVLKQSDGYWYEFFCRQITDLWDMGHEITDDWPK